MTTAIHPQITSHAIHTSPSFHPPDLTLVSSSTDTQPVAHLAGSSGTSTDEDSDFTSLDDVSPSKQTEKDHQSKLDTLREFAGRGISLLGQPVVASNDCNKDGTLEKATLSISVPVQSDEEQFSKSTTRSSQSTAFPIQPVPTLGIVIPSEPTGGPSDLYRSPGPSPPTQHTQEFSTAARHSMDVRDVLAGTDAALGWNEQFWVTLQFAWVGKAGGGGSLDNPRGRIANAPRLNMFSLPVPLPVSLNGCRGMGSLTQAQDKVAGIRPSVLLCELKSYV
jgi:hypothetical protein